MATPRSSPSRVLLDSRVRLDVENESGWATMECARREAFGCGDDGDLVVKGLTIMARLVDPPAVSYLAIRPTDAVLLQLKPGWWDLPRAEIVVTEEHLIIMVISLDWSSHQANYLIYDATDASLTMTPVLGMSTRYPRRWGEPPLPVRRPDGRYALVEMATEKFCQGGTNYLRAALFLWPPSLSSAQASASSIVPWQLKDPVFPDEMPAPHEIHFCVQQVFSFKGMAFWVDLSRGVLYCNHIHLLSDRRDRVRFHFIDLPQGCRLDWPHDCHAGELAKAFRTMGCAGDSIRFVSISGHLDTDKEDIADCKVTTWTLTPHLSWEWRKDCELRFGDLWTQPEFLNAGLSASVRPTVAVLSSQQEDEDGVLQLVLRGNYTDGCTRRLEPHILLVDMRGRRLLSSSPFPSMDYYYHSRILDSDFFKHLESHRLSPVEHLPPLAIPARPARLDVFPNVPRGEEVLRAERNNPDDLTGEE